MKANRIIVLSLAILLVGRAFGTAKNCTEILGANPSATSGVYNIDPDGPGGNAAFRAYCDMKTDGGGWTAFFSGKNGSSNVFSHFEDTAVACTNPKTQCLRRIPASVTTNDYILATCGSASVKLQVNAATLDYLQKGPQHDWQSNSNESLLVEARKRPMQRTFGQGTVVVIKAGF